jgi:hypothetical protein
MLVVTRDGLADYYRGNLTLQEWLNGLTLRCYQNPFVPVRTSVTADFLESTFPGYAPVAFSAWDSGAFDAADNLMYTHPEIDFGTTAAAAEFIQGVYATNAGGLTMFGEATPAPFPLPAAGVVFPTFPLFFAGQILPPL